jgi:CheY-like chemotaxis protein
VDDDRDLLTVGVQALGELGYTVLVARDGVEALRVFEAERHRIRLVVLDLSMPRLSGRDTLFQLRQIDPAVRVLLTSGHSLDGETGRLLDQAFGFVEKPFRLAAIARAVRAALDAPPLARATAPPEDGVRSS